MKLKIWCLSFDVLLDISKELNKSVKVEYMDQSCDGGGLSKKYCFFFASPVNISVIGSLKLLLILNFV